MEISTVYFLRPDELSLNIGNRVFVLEKFLDGWWQVAFIDDNQQQLVGLYPSNFLQEDSSSNPNNFVSPNSKTVSTYMKSHQSNHLV